MSKTERIPPSPISPLPRRAYWLSIAAGVVGGSAWLPTGLAPFIALVMMAQILALRDARTMRHALRLALVFGVVRYLTASHFLLALIAYSPLAIAFYLMATCFILPFSILESCGAFWLHRYTGFPRGLAFALLYVFGEWLRTLGDLSFPADLLSHAFGTAPSLTRFSAYTGPYGVPLWLCVTGWILAEGWMRRAEHKRWLPWMLIGLTVWWLPAIPWPQRDQERVTFKVGIVQPKVTIERKLASLRAPDREYWDEMKSLTREAAQGAALVIWPETARPGRLFLRDDQPLHDLEMEELASEVGVPILYGAEIVRTRGSSVVGLYNGAALVFPDHSPNQWYGKQRLLPFVEGFPFADWIGFDPAKRPHGKPAGGIEYLTLLGNFARGPEPTIFRVGDARIGVLICYEGMYPPLAREYAQRGANMLAVMTNDIWWGKSAFAPWHAQMVTARANELEIPVVRAANSGVSSYTDQHGVQHEHTASMWTGTLQIEAQLEKQKAATFYQRVGDWPIALIALLFAGSLVRRRFRR
ncbi:MAG: apolipoprotein N-acyltransferase [Acidobacteriota bacterium]